MIDYTALLKKLTPDRDGEPHVHLRTGTVDAVNVDGTLDIEMSSGVVVPDVPRLESANVVAGTVVQMISFRGVLLVIGAVQGSLGNPVAMLVRNTAQSHANNAWSAVSMNVALVDTHGGFSGGGYAVPTAGIYDVSATGSWAFHATGRRGIRLAVGGVAPTNYPATIGPTQTGAGEISLAGPSALLNLAAGALVEVQTFQNSGAALNNGAVAGYYPSLRVVRVGG